MQHISFQLFCAILRVNISLFHSYPLLFFKESCKTILELGHSSNIYAVHGMAVRPCWRPDSETTCLLTWCHMSRSSSGPAGIHSGKILHVVKCHPVLVGFLVCGVDRQHAALWMWLSHLQGPLLLRSCTMSCCNVIASATSKQPAGLRSTIASAIASRKSRIVQTLHLCWLSSACRTREAVRHTYRPRALLVFTNTHLSKAERARSFNLFSSKGSEEESLETHFSWTFFNALHFL